MDCKSVGERIKARKHALDITANDLSEKSGVPLDTINNIVYGRITNPGIDALTRIALALDTTLDHIILGKDPSPQKEETVDPKDHNNHFDPEKYVQILTDVHKREMDAQAKAQEDLIEELRASANLWRKLSCSLICFFGVILVYFIVDRLIG